MYALLEKKLALPAYDQCLKASHLFNLLDARGVIGVAERTGYINRIRELAKGSGAAWLKQVNLCLNFYLNFIAKKYHHNYKLIARKELKEKLKNHLEEESLKYKDYTYSSPTRLTFNKEFLKKLKYHLKKLKDQSRSLKIS